MHGLTNMGLTINYSLVMLSNLFQVTFKPQSKKVNFNVCFREKWKSIHDTN